VTAGGAAATGDTEGPIDKMQRAASEIEQATGQSGDRTPAAEQGVTRVQIEKARFNIQDYLWSGTLGLLGFVGQAMVVFFVTFFLLVSGDSVRRKMVPIAGPTFTRKKVTLQLLDGINAQIQRYLVIQIFTTVLVGVVTLIGA